MFAAGHDLTEPILEIRGVVKAFSGSERAAVSGIDLSVTPGEIVSLLGPSGCGKTTTLRLIAGFERPDAGEIHLAGKPVATARTWVPPEQRGVGMVFQDYALFPHLSVSRNVTFGLKNWEPREVRAREAEILELVDLSGLANRFPHELSGGQQQRVAMARALCPQPVMILLDEPFSNLDTKLRVAMRQELRRILKAAGTTALFVTHDQRDAFAISDRIVVMEAGMVIQEGSPRQIYQKPANHFVATFVGESNILGGVVGDGGKGVHTDIGRVPYQGEEVNPGEQVEVCIRPDSFEFDPEGPVRGVLVEATYLGSSIEGTVEIQGDDGEVHRLLVHIHPEEDVKPGSPVSFRILPDFVSVIRKA